MSFIRIFILSISFLFIASSSISAQATKTVEVSEESISYLSPKVKGITCSRDVKTISQNVSKLKGVISCEKGRTGPTTRFKVAYDPTVITIEEIYAAIENTPGCKNPKDRPYKVKNK